MEKVFSAISDNNRRKIIELLHEEDSTLLELAEKFPFSFQALSRHIKILEGAEIVTKKRKGKYRVLSLNRNALRSSLQWISYYSAFWNQSFDNLEEQINRENTNDHK